MVYTQDQIDTPKTMIITNQSAAPIKYYLPLTCFSSIETKPRCFMNPINVAYIKHNILGAPTCENYIQTLNIQDYTLSFKHSPIFHLTFASFTQLIQRNFPFLSFIIQIKQINKL